MVIVKLLGGLGNQMFQYAAGRSLLKNGESVYLDYDFFDTTRIDAEHSVIRQYELNIFNNINVDRAKSWQLNIFKSQSYGFKLLRNTLRTSFKFIHHPTTDYLPIAKLAANKHTYLDGYFQSENYFAHIRNELLNEFQFPMLDPINEAIKKKIQDAPNSVSVHIRRGDYLRSKTVLEVHGVLPLGYYKKAIDILKGKFSSLTLFFFSDDIAWVKENFSLPDLQVNFISNNFAEHSWKDMALMGNCQHHIIANSSFSWWGAWLSTHCGEVLAPYHWFNPLKVKYNIHEIVPDKWTIVKYD
jgi:hypothetical protein